MTFNPSFSYETHRLFLLVWSTFVSEGVNKGLEKNVFRWISALRFPRLFRDCPEFSFFVAMLVTFLHNPVDNFLILYTFKKPI